MFTDFCSGDIHEVFDSQPEFVSQVRQWSHHERPIHLTQCHFDPQLYNQHQHICPNQAIPDSIKKSVSKRQTEFIAGRFAAISAIAALTGSLFNDVPSILIKPDRSPLWPNGIKGSISHHNFSAVAIVSNANEIKHLGIDTECIISDKTALEIADQIHTPDEIKLFLKEGFSINLATTLILSAKESLYKALYPIHQVFFDFREVMVTSLVTDKSEMTLKLDHSLHHHTPIFKKTFSVNFNLTSPKAVTTVLIA